MLSVGFTCGDPGGIGPEIILDIILQNQKNPRFRPIIFGPIELKTLPYFNNQWKTVTWISNTSKIPFTQGETSAANGQHAYESVFNAVKYAQSGKIQALVTAPLSKTALKLANLPYTGHTSLLKKLTGSKNISMAFYSKPLTLILNSIHCPLKNVPLSLTPSHLGKTIENSYLLAKHLKLTHPKIAIAGLNPHAGEGGLLGTEEQEILIPFLKNWNQKHDIPILGPFSPDTLFYRAIQKEFDIVIALYHDQGLIALKTVAFDSAVNLTIGLPFIRTSPDHGTAFDIAYRHKASSNSISAATALAIRLAQS